MGLGYVIAVESGLCGSVCVRLSLREIEVLRLVFLILIGSLLLWVYQYLTYVQKWIILILIHFHYFRSLGPRILVRLLCVVYKEIVDFLHVHLIRDI